MSTRCNIVFKDGNYEFFIYHHCDGHLNGVGRELRAGMQKGFMQNHWYVTDYVNELIKHGMTERGVENSENYELTTGIHGDIDYLYEIDYVEEDERLYPRLLCWRTERYHGGKESLVEGHYLHSDESKSLVFSAIYKTDYSKGAVEEVLFIKE